MHTIPLDAWMKVTKLAPTTSIARRLIVEGCVFVNGERVTSIAREIGPFDTVEVIK